MNMPLDPATRASPYGAARRTDTTIGRPVRRRRVSTRAIERRRRGILWAKRVLPASALLLLSMIVMWPEFSHITAAGNRALHRLTAAATLSGELLNAHYRGVDAHGHAYTLTAISGRQITDEVVELNHPKADTTLSSGAWVMVTADHGTFVQHKSELDLWGHVVLYRDDGLFVRTSVATMDLKLGFAAGTHLISAEGPFGTLDANGFVVGDKGTMAQFTGPARLVLNARHQ